VFVVTTELFWREVYSFISLLLLYVPFGLDKSWNSPRRCQGHLKTIDRRNDLGRRKRR
jgi:hypothetical protein